MKEENERRKTRVRTAALFAGVWWTIDTKKKKKNAWDVNGEVVLSVIDRSRQRDQLRT